MKHFRDRSELIEYIENDAPMGSIRIAMQDDSNVEYLGFFHNSLSHVVGMWIVRVEVGDYEWYVALVRAFNGRHHVDLIDKGRIPWHMWEETEIKSDNPEKYKELRDAETKRRGLLKDTGCTRISSSDNRTSPDATDGL